MMRKISRGPVFWTALLGAVVLIIGCVPSLYSLYEGEKDLVWEPDLLGHWVGEDSSWIFSPMEPESDAPKMYQVLVLDEDNTVQGNLAAGLVKLGEQRFLDTTLAKTESFGDYNAMHIQPTHLIWHVQSTSPTLKMRAMDPEWLNRFVGENPDKIAVENMDNGDRVLLRAKPKELQAFVLQHLGEDELFGADVSEMKRPAAVKKEKE